MEKEELKKELCLLLCHYLRYNYPELCEKFTQFCEKNKFTPENCISFQEALCVRYSSFPVDNFFQFIKTLRPLDDFPSVFRRITDFPKTVTKTHFSFGPIHRVICHRDSLYCISCDYLARILVTGADDHSIKIFRLPELTFVMRLVGHDHVITNVSINPLCTLLMSSSHDKTIRIWSLVDGSCLSILSGFTFDIIHYAVFSPTGSMIAAACEDGTVPLWTLADALVGKPPCRTLRSPAKGPVAWVSFSPGGEFLVYSSEPSIVTVVPLKSMTQNILEHHQSLVDTVCFSKNFYGISGEVGPKLLTVSNEEGAAVIWQMEAGKWKVLHSFKHMTSGRRVSKITRVAWDNNEHLIVVARTHSISIYDSINGELIGQLPDIPVCEECKCIVASPTHQSLFFIANSSGDVAVVDIHSLEILAKTNVSHSAGFIDAVWSPDGQYIYASDTTGAVTSFKCCFTKSNEPAVTKIVEIFEKCEINKGNDSHLLCDSKGSIYKPQPPRIEIRSMDLEIKILQPMLLRDCATELLLIQRLISSDHPQTTNGNTAPVIAGPPQHIPLTNDIPLNPKGPDLIFDDDQIEENNEQSLSLHIESDSDTWDFDGNKQNSEESVFYAGLVQGTDRQTNDSWPLWMTAVTCEENTYMPQKGDEVMFLRSAYVHLIEEEKLNESITELPNHDTTRCSVNDIEPIAGGVRILLSHSISTFSVVFPIPEKVAYLVPLYKYRAAINSLSKLGKGAKIVVPFVEENGKVVPYQGIVESVNKNSEENPFESIAVKWNHNEETFISPWEIFSINGRKMSQQEKNIPTMVIRAAITIIESSLVDEKYKFIHNLSNLLPEEREKVTFPISLNIIKERLESFWYHTIPAILSDLDLLLKMTEDIFGKESENAKISQKIIEQISDNIDEAKKASPSAKKKKSI